MRKACNLDRDWIAYQARPNMNISDRHQVWQQTTVLCSHNFVALAGPYFQLRAINDRDVTPRVSNDASRL